MQHVIAPTSYGYKPFSCVKGGSTAGSEPHDTHMTHCPSVQQCYGQSSVFYAENPALFFAKTLEPIAEAACLQTVAPLPSVCRRQLRDENDYCECCPA